MGIMMFAKGSIDGVLSIDPQYTERPMPKKVLSFLGSPQNKEPFPYTQFGAISIPQLHDGGCSSAEMPRQVMASELGFTCYSLLQGTMTIVPLK